MLWVPFRCNVFISDVLGPEDIYQILRPPELGSGEAQRADR